MSLFQCKKCGCVENTACSDMAPMMVYLYNAEFIEHKAAMESWKRFLGILLDQPFEPLCSACSPVWYTPEGYYGVGNPPDNHWHGRFKRMFLPKGKFVTDDDGNLKHCETGDKDIDKYILDREEGT